MKMAENDENPQQGTSRSVKTEPSEERTVKEVIENFFSSSTFNTGNIIVNITRFMC